MLPLVKPVALIKSFIEVPQYPLQLNMGAVFSIMNCRVRSALEAIFDLFGYKYIKMYQSVYYYKKKIYIKKL